jgi:hypothetical protein
MAERVLSVLLLVWLWVIIELVLSKGGGKLHFSFEVLEGDKEVFGG